MVNNIVLKIYFLFSNLHKNKNNICYTFILLSSLKSTASYFLRLTVLEDFNGRSRDRMLLRSQRWYHRLINFGIRKNTWVLLCLRLSRNQSFVCILGKSRWRSHNLYVISGRNARERVLAALMSFKGADGLTHLYCSLLVYDILYTLEIEFIFLLNFEWFNILIKIGVS